MSRIRIPLKQGAQRAKGIKQLSCYRDTSCCSLRWQAAAASEVEGFKTLKADGATGMAGCRGTGDRKVPKITCVAHDWQICQGKRLLGPRPVTWDLTTLEEDFPLEEEVASRIHMWGTLCAYGGFSKNLVTALLD
jgi:hypothetical protein